MEEFKYLDFENFNNESIPVFFLLTRVYKCLPDLEVERKEYETFKGKTNLFYQTSKFYPLPPFKLISKEIDYNKLF